MKLVDLPDIEFVDADAEHVKAALFADYISITGRTLAQGDPVRLFLLVVAEAFIRLLNNQNYVGKQNLLRYATGDNLDHLGALTDTTRIPASAATTTLLITLAAKREQETIVKAGTRVATDKRYLFRNQRRCGRPGREHDNDGKSSMPNCRHSRKWVSPRRNKIHS